MDKPCDTIGYSTEAAINGDITCGNAYDEEKKTVSSTFRNKNKQMKEQKDCYSITNNEMLHGDKLMTQSKVKQNKILINGNQIKSDKGNETGKERTKEKESEKKEETEGKENVEDEEEEEMYSLPSDSGIEFPNVIAAKDVIAKDDVENLLFYDVSDEYDDLLENESDTSFFYERTSNKGKLENEEEKNHSQKNTSIRKKNNKRENKNEKITSQLWNPKLSSVKKFDLHEQIKSTIELCVPKFKSSKDAEDRILDNMEKISKINLKGRTNSETLETVEHNARSLYENVDHILDATNKMKLEKGKDVSINSDLNRNTNQVINNRANGKNDVVVEIENNKGFSYSQIKKGLINESTTATKILDDKKHNKQVPNVDYYLKSSMIELNDCINKLYGGCCGFKERNMLVQKITNIVPELNNLYNNKNLCYIKDNPSIKEIAHILPEWKISFEKMHIRALEDTEEMKNILKRIKNMKSELYLLNKDLTEDREEFENIKFETVEHDSAVTLVEKKNKNYIKGALKLDNMGQKLKKAFNIPVNPLTNFTISEHINRLLNYEEELLMGNDYLGKYNKPHNFEILRFKNNNKKFELFEKEDGEACYVIDMLINDLKKVYEEKKKEFERIDKKMKLYEMTDINKFKVFMDVILNNHSEYINEFKESIQEAILNLFDIYEYFSKKNFKVKKIDESYIKNYVNKNIILSDAIENKKKKEKIEEKYFMSLNFTRKKPIDHPFFIYHCLSENFVYHFINFILTPESLENQKNFMQHCSISGFNTVVFSQQILKLRKQEKNFTPNDYSYDFSSAYSKVLCADLCFIMLKSVTDNNCYAEQTGENKYLIALRNASDDYFENTFKKKINAGFKRDMDKITTRGANIIRKGKNTTTLKNRMEIENEQDQKNFITDDVLTSADHEGLGFQLLHYIPDELTSVNNKYTVICCEDKNDNKSILSTIKNCDLNRFNILKTSCHPILSNTSNDILHRRAKEKLSPFLENSSENRSNEAIDKFLMTYMPSVLNMAKENIMSGKEDAFPINKRYLLENNSSIRLFNNTTAGINNFVNNVSLTSGNNLFNATNYKETNTFGQNNPSILGNNTTNNRFNTSSNNLLNNTTNSIFGNNSTNIFGTNTNGLFNNNKPLSDTTNSFLNNSTFTSTNANLFGNNTKNVFLGNTERNSLGSQNNTNTMLNKGNGLTNNVGGTSSLFNSYIPTNTANTSGTNANTNISGNINTYIAKNNANNIFNQNKTNIFANNTSTESTGKFLSSTPNSFMSNNMNKNTINNEGTNSFGILGKSDTAANNSKNLFGNNNSSNFFSGKTTNQTSDLFTSNFNTGTNIFGNSSNNNNNNNNNSNNNNNTSVSTVGFQNMNHFTTNNINALGSGNLFSNAKNNPSSLFNNNYNNNNNNTSIILGRNEPLSTGNNIFNKTSVTNSGCLFGNTNPMNNTDITNNRNTNSNNIFSTASQQNNNAVKNIGNNNIFSTNTNTSFLSPKSNGFISNLEQSKFTNNSNLFSTGNINNTVATTNTVNRSLFGMNNNTSSIGGNTGTNANNSFSNIFGNKISGNTFSSNVLGETNNFIMGNSFNNNGIFNNNQTSSFLGKTGVANTLNNSFSSKMNDTNTFSNSSFGANSFGNTANTSNNVNTSVNTFPKSSYLQINPTASTGVSTIVNNNTNIFGNNPNGSSSNLFGGTNSTNNINPFGNNLNSATMTNTIPNNNTNNIFGSANRSFGATNNFNSNTSINNINTSSNLFMSNTGSQSNNANRNNIFGNAMNNKTNLFSKDNLTNSNTVNRSNDGNTTSSLFQNQSNNFTSNNRIGSNMFGLNDGLTNNNNNNNSNSNSNATTNMFQNNSFLTGRQNVSNTQSFNLQTNQNLFQQNS